MAEDYGATVRQWTDVLRRCRLPKSVKLVGLLMANYADSDGTRVFPGIARVAVESGLTYNVAQEAVAKLRSVGLLELIRQGTRRGEGDEYRLVLMPDLLDRVEVWNPAQVSVAIDRMRTQRRGQVRPKDGPDGPDLHPTDRGADNPDVHPTNQGAPESGAPHLLHSNQVGAPPFSARCTPLSDPPPTTDLDTTTPTPPTTGLDTASHGPRASPAEPENPIVVCECSRGYVLSPDGSEILRCPTCPPSNVIPLRRPA